MNRKKASGDFPSRRGSIRSVPLDLTEEFTPSVFPKTESQAAFLNGVLKDNFIFMDMVRNSHNLVCGSTWLTL